MPDEAPIQRESERNHGTPDSEGAPGGASPADRFLLRTTEAPATLGELFAREGSIELEIGCGKGAFLVAAAESYPEVNFVGVEVATPFARGAAERMARRSLENVRVLVGDAGALVRERLAADSIQAIHVFFPDPWPKKRHHKRRLVTREFLADVYRVLRPGGMLCLGTDFVDYYRVMRELCDGDGRFARVLDYEWRGGAGVTNFERKYLRDGRTSHRAVYRRRSPDTDWSRL